MKTKILSFLVCISILLSGISFAQTPTTGSTTSQKINVPLMLKEQGSTPATPQSGYDKLYFKTDGYLYRLSDGGVETNISAGQATEIPDYTVATLPASPTLGQLAYVTDGNSGTDCVSGEGAFKVLCIYNGSAWVTTSITGAGTGDVLGPATNTADKIPQWSGADSKTLKDGLTLSTDGALGTSDTTIPSQKAIKTYADTMVTKATYNAQTILAATSDDTPAALTVGEQTVVGRATGGNIAALSIDSDISSVSANDDTVPSAKATKTYADTKQTSDATLTSLAGLSGVQGDIIYASGSDAYAVLNKDANATRYLSNTGTSNNPAWAQVNLANGVTGTLPLANGGTGVAFTDPNADRIMVWDDSAGSLAWMSLGTGLSISATPSLDLDADLVTLAGLTVTRGDLIVGSSSPAWTDLAIGSANTVLITDGSDPSWGTITSAMITDNTITASDLAATLTFAATDLVDFSSMVRTGNSQDYGIVLPAWANFTPATKVGWITWDTSAKSIKVYDAGWKEFATAAAPITSTYVTVTDETATLTGSRYLVAGTAVDFTDGGAASTFTIGVDTTEIGTTTYGAGSAITTTYDASAGTDCTQAWGDNTTTITCGTVNVAGAISSSGAITPSSANGAALGSATYEWSDLFLHDGAVIYGQADQSATLTSSASLWTANNFAVTGYLAIGSDPADAGSIRLPNAGYIYSEAAPAGTDISVIGVDSGEIIQIGASGASGVTITPALTVVGAILPSVSNTPALGSTSLMWADLFLGSGAVINFNNDVTLTHGSNVLTLGGGDLALGANNLTYTGYIASGSDPADAGAIRLSNADNITWEASAAGTDVVGISVDASEVVQIGSSGASAVTITPNTTVSGTLTSTGNFTANANATFGNADTDTLTLRSLLVGGNSRAVWIAGSAPTPSYATGTNELYVAGDIETAGNVYASNFVGGAGTDTQRRLSLTSNTSFDCAAYPDSLYFVSDALYWCQSTSAKTPMKLEDAQTITGKKTFQADIAVGDASNAGSIDIYDGSSNYVILQTGTMSADYTMVLPTGAGTTGQYLTTTTSGTTATLSWGTPTASADTTGGTGGVQFNAAGVLTSDAGFVFNTTTDKLSLGSSGGSTTGTIDLYYTGTTYAATITPNASMASDITITLPAGTSTLIGSGANTYTGNQTFDDGVGDSPAIIFTDATDQTTTLSKVDNSFFKIVNSAGGIALQPSGDTDDYLLVTTATNVPTIATVGNANLTFDVANSGATSTFTITNSDGTYTANLSVEGTITGGGATFTGGTNTFNITNGTASLDVAAGAAVNIDTGLTVDTAAVTLKGKSGGSTLTLPTALDLDETMTDANLCKFTASGTKISCDVAQTTFQASDAELTAIAGLTFADASVIQLTGAAAAAVLTSGGNNYILGSNSNNTALEFKTPANVLSQIGAQAADTDLTTWAGITPGENVGTFLATPSSSNLAAAVTGETGSGALVFGTSPSITTSLLPAAATATIGSTTAEWGNVYLTDGAVIYGQADQSATLTSSASLWTANNLSVATQFKVPSSNADPTATAGYFRHDSTVTNYTNGAIRWHDGTNIRQLVDLVAATAEGCSDDYVIAYDADADLFYCKADATGAGAGDVGGVGDCTGGDCLDGSSDGGTYIRLYDGTSAYESITGGVRTITFASSTADAENAILTFGNNDNTLTLSSGTGAASLNLNAFSVSANGFVPDAADGAALGSATLEFSDLYLADGGVIYFQNDQSVYLTPSAGVLTLTGAFVSTGAITPSSANGAALGSATNEWADLYLHDGAVIYGQADQSATLTSSASTWAASAFSVTGALTANGAVTLGDAGDDVIVKANVNASDGTFSGITITRTVDAGSASSFGQAMYVASDGELVAADADSATTGPAVCILVTAGTGASKQCVTHGTITETDWNWTVGGIIYLSTDPTTTTGLVQTAPSGTGDVVQVLGVALSADTILFQPSLVQVVLE